MFAPQKAMAEVVNIVSFVENYVMGGFIPSDLKR